MFLFVSLPSLSYYVLISIYSLVLAGLFSSAGYSTLRAVHEHTWDTVLNCIGRSIWICRVQCITGCAQADTGCFSDVSSPTFSFLCDENIRLLSSSYFDLYHEIL